MSKHDDFVGNLLAIGAGLVAISVVFLCAGAGTCWVGGGAFVRFGVASDLEEYRDLVTASDLSEPDQAEVLRRLGSIRERVRSGDVAVPFVVWVTIDEAIEDLLLDGQVPPAELAALHDQLTRIEGYR